MKLLLMETLETIRRPEWTQTWRHRLMILVYVGTALQCSIAQAMLDGSHPALEWARTRAVSLTLALCGATERALGIAMVGD
jgi:hypothetical protein